MANPAAQRTTSSSSDGQKRQEEEKGDHATTPSDGIHVAEPETTKPVKNTSGVAAPRLPNGRRPIGAWLCAAGSACSLFGGFGLLNAFGIFENYYLTGPLRESSSSDVAWIGSVEIGLLFGGNLVSGPLLDRFGPTPLMIYQALVLPLSCMMTSLSKRYYQFLLAQGVLQGLSLACSFSVPLACNTMWFMDNRPLGSAIPVAGSALGGVIWPVIVRNALPVVGLGWTWRIIGFAELALCTFSVLTVRRPPKPDGSGPQVKQRQKFFYPEAYKHMSYALLQTAFLFNFLGVLYVFFFLPTIGAANGMSSSLQDYSISILNAASIFGRLFLPLGAHWIGPLNTLSLCMLASAIIVLCSINVTSTAGLLVIGGFYGLASGAIFTLIAPTVAAVIPDVQRLGSALGQLCGCVAISVLLSTPIAGWISDTPGGFNASAVFAGGCLLVGAAFSMAARIFQSKKLIGIA